MFDDITKRTLILAGIVAAGSIATLVSLNKDRKEVAKMLTDEFYGEYEDLFDTNFEDDSSKI